MDSCDQKAAEGVGQTVQSLADHVGGRVEGQGGLIINRAATLSEAQAGDVSFLANPRYEKQLKTTKASVVVVDEAAVANGQTLIRSSDPYYAFRQIMVLLHGHRNHPPAGVSERARVAQSARLGEGVTIHDFVSIMDQAEIGDQTQIYPNCTVGPGTRIGKKCIIYPNVTIYDGCRIGDRVTIHAGTVVGVDGFGYATHDGAHHKFPHIGTVVIENDVEIGANCAIDRGTMGDTVIGRGSKISNLVAIGHNVRIGPHCLLVAQVGIAGSTTVGEYCLFGGQSGVIGHVRIGDRVKVGGQAGVLNSVADDQSVTGTPAIELSLAKRTFASIKHLPEFRRKIRQFDRILRKHIKGK